MFHVCRLLTICLMLALSITSFCSAETPQFRMTSKIYQDQNNAPSAIHHIYFDGNRIYDESVIGESTLTVYDIPQGKVILLNTKEKTRTTIQTEDLVRITAQARSAAESLEQKQSLGIESRVTVKDDRYRISFRDAAYETEVQSPKDLSIALRYGEFVDMASRLNLVQRLGLPPFARMTLSSRIAADGKLPKTTILTLQRESLTQRFRSTHEVQNELTQNDQSRIAEIGSMLALFPEVPLQR